MNRKKNRNSRNFQERKTNKIMRCSAKNKPVFEHETCNEFKARGSSDTQKTCQNCKNAF